jgi:predicted transcriptional regulator
MERYDTQENATRLACEAGMIREALDDVAAGRTISMEAMLKWIRSIGTANPLPEPEPDQV